MLDNSYGERGYVSNKSFNEKLVNIINNCFWAESYLTILIKIEENLDKFENYPELFITINRAITDAFIILVSKIYDENSSGANIMNILNMKKIYRGVDENVVNLEMIKKYVKEKNEELAGEKIEILKKNLKVWRDKFYAHTDIEFLNDEGFLREKHKISIQEFYELINFAKCTAQHIYLLINNKYIGCDLKFKCEKELDLLIKVLEDHKRIYNNLYKEI